MFARIFSRRDSYDSETGSPTSPQPVASPKSQGANVWQGVFNPGRNYSDRAQRTSRDYFDSGKATVWDQYVKSQTLQRLSFSDLDKDGDGYLNANDLQQHFGRDANVDRMIQAADKDKDGRISLAEFREMVQNS